MIGLMSKSEKAQKNRSNPLIFMLRQKKGEAKIDNIEEVFILLGENFQTQ